MQIGKILETTPAAPATTPSAFVVQVPGYASSVSVTAELVGATGGALDVYVQTKIDGVWFDVLHFAQLAAGAAALKVAANITRHAAQAITTIGRDATPALAASGIVQGLLGESLRALYVAGVGTTVGAGIVLRFGWSAT
jgi:hypothetical protein